MLINVFIFLELISILKLRKNTHIIAILPIFCTTIIMTLIKTLIKTLIMFVFFASLNI